MKETIEFVLNQEAVKQKEEILKKGYAYVCLRCRAVFKDIPTKYYKEYSCTGANLPECPACGCDLFQPINEVDCTDIIVKPRRGKIILKKHNFKYCECDKGRLWTGDAGTECWADFELLEELKSGAKIYKCSVSGLKCVVLPSTQEELDNAGYLRYP